MIAGIAKLKICTSMASSVQPPKHAQKVRFSPGLSSRYHPVGLSYMLAMFFLPYIPARPAPFIDLDLSCTAHAEEYLREEGSFIIAP
jgi:hypothetical protein